MMNMTSFVKKILFFAGLFVLLIPSVACDEDEPALMKSDILSAAFEAKISSDDYVAVGRQFLLDAGDSTLLDSSEYGTARYLWAFEDGEKKSGKELFYSFSKKGVFNVTLTINQGAESVSIEKNIVVFDKRALLITDSHNVEKSDELKLQAGENGIWLEVFFIEPNDIKFLNEEELIIKFTSSINFIKKTDSIIFFTNSLDALSDFARFYNSLSPENTFYLDDIFFVSISEWNLDIQKAIVDRSRKFLGIEEILLTRPEALNPIFEIENISEIKKTLDLRAIEYMTVDESTERSGFFVLSRIISYFVSSGVSSDTIYLLLVFPFIAFLIAFARQFVGVSTYGVYLPIMVSLSFFVLGINFAFVVLALVGILGMGIRFILNKVEMQYIPRVALTLSTIALSFFVVIWFALKMHSSVVIPMAIFPMLVMSTLSEKFVSTKSHEGLRNAALSVIETILVAFFAYLITNLELLNNLIISYPETILLPLIGIIILGRFTGLRIFEYFKFRALFRDGTEE